MPFAFQVVEQIVVHTPLWVWPLMLLVLWLGWLGLRPVVPGRLSQDDISTRL